MDANNKEPILLAMLGRGIQHPSAESMEWTLTPDLEVCDEKGAHLPVASPENDADPNSIVGGGAINALAGAILSQSLHPTLAVCAFGARSKYLNSIGAPSESQVMSESFMEELRLLGGTIPAIDIFNESEWPIEGSGTNQELKNIFMLAAKKDISRIVIVTVAVQIPRATLMAKAHLDAHPEFKNIILNFYSSELVLLKENAEQYQSRVNKIFASQSYIRNFERELRGMNDFLEGKYKSVASTIK